MLGPVEGNGPGLAVSKEMNSPVAGEATADHITREDPLGGQVHKTQLLGMRNTAVLEGFLPTEVRTTHCTLREKSHY